VKDGQTGRITASILRVSMQWLERRASGKNVKRLMVERSNAFNLYGAILSFDIAEALCR